MFWRFIHLSKSGADGQSHNIKVEVGGLLLRPEQGELQVRRLENGSEKRIIFHWSFDVDHFSFKTTAAVEG